MQFDDKFSEREKLLVIAREILPAYRNSVSKAKETQLPQKSKISAWLSEIDLSQLEDRDLIILLEIETFLNSVYPDEEAILNVNDRPKFQIYNATLTNFNTKFYATPFKKFCYQVSILQKLMQQLNVIKDTNYRVVSQIQDVLLDLRLELLIVDFFNDPETIKALSIREDLLKTQDFDAINTILVLEIEGLVYKIAQKHKFDIYQQEENNYDDEFVVKQLIKPEFLIHQFLNSESLANYKILFQALDMVLYDQKYRLFIERRYLQKMNGKLPFNDHYLTALLMLLVTALNYVLE